MRTNFGSYQLASIDYRKYKTMGKLRKLLQLWLLLYVAFSASNVTAVGAPELGLLAPDIQRILDKGVLRVAMYHKDTPPFYYVDEQGELTGVDVELIKGFASLLNVAVEFDRSAKTFNDVIKKVSNREADLAICKLSITFSRTIKVLFTKPYIKLRKGLLVNRVLLQRQLDGRTKEEAIKNLTGKIGVIGKSSYVDYAKHRFHNMELVEYRSWGEIVEAVINQDVVAGFRDEAEIKRVIRDNTDNAVTLLTVVLKGDHDPKGIAVSWDSTHLKSALEFYIDSLGLDLSANKVLFEYESVIETIKRNSTK